MSLSLDELRKMGSTELVAGFECSGNRRPLQGLFGNGRWTGVPLQDGARACRPESRRRARSCSSAPTAARKRSSSGRRNSHVEQQYGRSLPREQALSSDAFLAYALNGEPLTRHQGAPLRLLVPGWYGVANVKWLSRDSRAGRRVSRQVPGALVPDAARRDDQRRDEVDRDRRSRTCSSKSFVARVTQATAADHKVLGVVLNDGTPIKSVEVQVDDGPWQAATIDPATTREVLVEAVHLRLEQRDARRAHARVARDRRQRAGAADARGDRDEEDVPRGQLAASAQGDDRLQRRYGRTPAFLRIAIIGHQPLNADWNRFSPTNSVNQKKFGCT